MLKEVLKKATSRFEGAWFDFSQTNYYPVLTVKKEHLYEIAKELKENKDAFFDHLSFVTVVDYLHHFELVYFLHSYKHHHWMVLKTKLPLESPEVSSVTSLWETADFHEREAYDLYGVKFIGHSNLKRILLAEDFPGHPFRKSHPFVNDDEYLLKEGYPEEKNG